MTDVPHHRSLEFPQACEGCGAVEGEVHNIACKPARENCHSQGYCWEEMFVGPVHPLDMPMFTAQETNNLLQVGWCLSRSPSGIFYSVADLSKLSLQSQEDLSSKVPFIPCQYQFINMDCTCMLEQFHDGAHLPITGEILHKMSQVAGRYVRLVVFNISRQKPEQRTLELAAIELLERGQPRVSVY